MPDKTRMLQQKTCYSKPLCRHFAGLLLLLCAQCAVAVTDQPSFLLVISDDQSWLHTSKAGYPYVKTPAFDAIAEQGAWFSHAYASAPSCTASRSSLLTGRQLWHTESGALLNGTWPGHLASFQDILQQHGYATGFSGKGWGPGDLGKRNTPETRPEGPPFNTKLAEKQREELTSVDLAENFRLFLRQRKPDQPFSFWAGATEPHRPYISHTGKRLLDAPYEAALPAFLPDTEHVRKTFSRYLREIELFDNQLGALVQVAREEGALDNLMIIVTSDNGMPFSRAKPHNYEYGVRVPLAIYWQAGINSPGRTINDMVSLVDIAPTLLELANIHDDTLQLDGKSLVPLLTSNKSGQIDPQRNYVITASEFHSSDDEDSRALFTYPRRAIHTHHYALIHNLFPERWPAGSPPHFRQAYASLLLTRPDKKPIEPWFTLNTQHRPEWEFYDLRQDPYQLVNQMDNGAYSKTIQTLQQQIASELTSDPVSQRGEDYFARYLPKPQAD